MNIWKTGFDSGNKEQLVRLHQRVNKLYSLGDHKQAIEVAIQACDFAQKHFGEMHSELAASLNNLAELYYEMPAE